MPLPPDALKAFAPALLAWHRTHGRHDLPWQASREPYRVWLSEIMLQQTQVATVIPYYHRFLARFPTLADLAAAPTEDVMGLWSGLGYYARARNLHACAKAVMVNHGGTFPEDPVVIAQLPGIGPSTANAIAVFCFGARAPILDGNVKRVLTRCFGIEGFPGNPKVERELWKLASVLFPARHGADYIQAQMDLGATVCTRSRPRCTACPLATQCIAHREQREADLPTARPRKAIPQRHATFLILQAANHVLLVQRPPSGLWGGLLTLPELPEGEAADTWMATNLGVRRSRPWSAMPPLTHTFTHFRLHIQPLWARLTKAPPLPADAPHLRWFSLADIDSAPLPVPVRTLLASLRSQ